MYLHNISSTKTTSKEVVDATSSLDKDAANTETGNVMEGEADPYMAAGVETTKPHSNICQASSDTKIIGVYSNHTTCLSITTISTTVGHTGMACLISTSQLLVCDLSLGTCGHPQNNSRATAALATTTRCYKTASHHRL